MKQEEALIKRGQQAVQENGERSFLGLTYLLTLTTYPTSVDAIPQAQYTLTNRFTLIAPNGDVAWVYEKAFPVPIVEVTYVHYNMIKQRLK